MYIVSIWRTVAIRSASWPSARQARHQTRMSSSDGFWSPCSNLLIFVKCQPTKAASARPVRFASLRISRSRAPSASRACWTEVDKSGGLVLDLGAVDIASLQVHRFSPEGAEERIAIRSRDVLQN